MKYTGLKTKKAVVDFALRELTGRSGTSPLQIVDSSVWIDSLNNRVTPAVRALRRAGAEPGIGLCDLIPLEVLQGLRSQSVFEETLQSLSSYPIFTLGGIHLAIKAAQNYRFLRSRGCTIRKPIDCLIATFCIENGFDLLRSDRGYLPFEEHLGLKPAAV